MLPVFERDSPLHSTTHRRYPSHTHTHTHTPTHSTLLHQERHSTKRHRETRKTETSFPSFFPTRPTFSTSPRCNQTRPLSHEAVTSGIRLSLPSRSLHPSLQPRSRNNDHHRHRSPISSFWVSLNISRDCFHIPRRIFFRKQHISTCTLPSLLMRFHSAPLVAVANMSSTP